ncbi:hypothetical protein [Dipodfec virus UOA04_Rod_1048]|nr:hypothetical protein [Dipodfec virus UOA04_Rod_1048]
MRRRRISRRRSRRIFRRTVGRVHRRNRRSSRGGIIF